MGDSNGTPIGLAQSSPFPTLLVVKALSDTHFFDTPLGVTFLDSFVSGRL